MTIRGGGPLGISLILPGALSRMITMLQALLAKPVIANLFPKGSIRLRFAKGALWSLIGAIIAQGLGLLASVAVARLLGRERYGELGIIQSTLAVFAAFTSSAMGLTATKYVAELRFVDPQRTGRIIGLSTYVAAGAGVLLATALWGLAPNLASGALNAPHIVTGIQLASIALFFNSISSVQTGILSGLEAFNAIARLNLWRGLLNFPVMFWGAWRWNLEGAVAALGLVALTGVLMNGWMLGKELSRAKIPVHRRALLHDWRILSDFSLPAFLSSILVVAASWMANTMLVKQPGGYGEMGIFNAANQWRIAILFIPNAISQPMLPMLAELYGLKESRRFLVLLKTNLFIVFTSTLLAASGVAVASRWIMGAYGAEFSRGELVLIVLSFSTVLSASLAVTGSAILSMGKMWHGFALNCIWAIAFLTTFSVLVGHSALGLSVSYLVSYVVHLVTVGTYVTVVVRHKG